MDGVRSRRGSPSDLPFTFLTHSSFSRWFDFLSEKAQHSPFYLDKEVFCDSLLDLADAPIQPRSRTPPRPPGIHHHEGVLVSATAAYFVRMPYLFTCLGRRPR
jgi:hypothetical protein